MLSRRELMLVMQTQMGAEGNIPTRLQAVLEVVLPVFGFQPANYKECNSIVLEATSTRTYLAVNLYSRYRDIEEKTRANPGQELPRAVAVHPNRPIGLITIKSEKEPEDVLLDLAGRVSNNTKLPVVVLGPGEDLELLTEEELVNLGYRRISDAESDPGGLASSGVPSGTGDRRPDDDRGRVEPWEERHPPGDLGGADEP